MSDNNKGMRQRLRTAGWAFAGALFVAGILFWGGFNWGLEMTNRETFCISCHEMEANVFQEYRNTIHYQNRTGVRATCPDCHVPKEWGAKMVRKIKASRELYGKVMGTIDTPEKFADERLRLAQNEWRRMKANNSQECRNCHNYEYFDYSVQGRRSNQMHQAGFAEGKTCIDCHKGIAHSLPQVAQDIGIDRGGVAPEVMHPSVPKQQQ